MSGYTACIHLACEGRYGCSRYRMRHARVQSVTCPKDTHPLCPLYMDVGLGAPFVLLSPEAADAQALETNPPPAEFSAILESEIP